MFANKDDYHASSVDDDDDVPQGREIKKPQTHIDHTGWLWKKARKPAASAPSPFKDRWFVLSRDRLLYFKSPTAQTAIAEIQLSEATIRIVDKYTDATGPPAFVSATAASQRLAAGSGPHVPDTAFSWMFEIDNKQRTYLLRAANAAEYNEWISRLLAACRPAIEENAEIGRLDWAGARMESDWAVREEDRIAALSILRNTLRDLIACEFFIGWEVDRGREESVLCWLDCEGWKGETSEGGRRDKGREIWDNYCKKGAAKEVRIDEVLREDIRSAIDSDRPSDGWIDRLQQHMHQLLMAVSFPAFLMSSAFYHACMAAVPTNSPPTSPAHHHQFALQKVKTLRMERGGGRSMGGGLPVVRVRGGREQERMEEEDMVIVLSDEDDRGGAAGGGSGGSGGKVADGAGVREDDMGRSYAGEGEVQTIGVEEENDYVNVSRDAGTETAAATVRSPVHQPMHQQPPPSAASHRQNQQQQQQRQSTPQLVTSPPQSPHHPPVQPQSPASFAPHPQPSPSQPQQQQKSGFFKSIFSKSSVPAANSGSGGSGSRPAAPVSSEQQKSVEDALASFYSSKPLAGGAIVTTGRPLPPQQPNQQQRPQPQQQLQQRPQPLSQSQPQSYPSQQHQRPPPSQQQQPPPSQYQQPYRQPVQPPPTAAVQAVGAGAAVSGFDMFDQLTIQGEPPSAPAATVAAISAPPQPAVSSPATFVLNALDDDIFGTPSALSPASPSPSMPVAPSHAALDAVTSTTAPSFSQPTPHRRVRVPTRSMMTYSASLRRRPLPPLPVAFLSAAGSLLCPVLLRHLRVNPPRRSCPPPIRSTMTSSAHPLAHRTSLQPHPPHLPIRILLRLRTSRGLARLPPPPLLLQLLSMQPAHWTMTYSALPLLLQRLCRLVRLSPPPSRLRLPRLLWLHRPSLRTRSVGWTTTYSVLQHPPAAVTTHRPTPTTRHSHSQPSSSSSNSECSILSSRSSSRRSSSQLVWTPSFPYNPLPPLAEAIPTRNSNRCAAVWEARACRELQGEGWLVVLCTVSSRVWVWVEAAVQAMVWVYRPLPQSAPLTIRSQPCGTHRRSEPT